MAVKCFIIQAPGVIKTTYSSWIVKVFKMNFKLYLFFSPKDLQPLIAAANVCLSSNSAAGKLNGLLALKVLVEDCNGQLFTQAGYYFGFHCINDERVRFFILNIFSSVRVIGFIHFHFNENGQANFIQACLVLFEKHSLMKGILKTE
jgi:hypothetical protein